MTQGTENGISQLPRRFASSGSTSELASVSLTFTERLFDGFHRGLVGEEGAGHRAPACRLHESAGVYAPRCQTSPVMAR